MVALGGISGMATSCSSYSVFKTKAVEGKIRIPLSEFTIDTDKIIRTPEIAFDILVRKQTDGSYKALIMRCTHQDWALNPGKKSIHCTLHGSQFDLDGKVLNGPAEKPLQTLKTSIENEFLILS